MNCVHLIGRLATDIELRDGVASSIIAVDRDSTGFEADFFRLKADGDVAAHFKESAVGKGRRIAIRGKLRQDIYDAIDGTERKAVSVHVDEFELL